MRFTYTETMCDPTFLVPLAQEAEAAGFDSFAVPDSICYPQESDSKYPYNADGSREFATLFQGELRHGVLPG